MKPWFICVDTGGTFTDCVARDPDGNLHRAKVLSSGALRARIARMPGSHTLELEPMVDLPDRFLAGFSLRRLGGEGAFQIAAHDAIRRRLRLAGDPLENLAPGQTVELFSPEEAPVLSARVVTRTPLGDSLPEMVLRVATTRGTNALLEGKGARVAFFVTEGFGDLLRIGTQQRPDLFALKIEKPEPLHHCVVEVPERLDAAGEVLRPLDVEALAGPIRAALDAGCESAAIALMHSYRNPVHEHKLAEVAREAGFRHVSESAGLAPSIKILPRAETAVVDSYLAPIMEEYLGRIEEPLPSASRLFVMTSAGGLVPRSDFRSKDGLLSGPAGGVVGATAAGKQAGYENIVAFDMGGTSTDVSRFSGHFDYTYEHRVGPAHLFAPALEIETVASGGGSICGFRDDTLFVGPESAGAAPGPACYGADGPLTLTDVNVLLGRMDPDAFGIPLDLEAAQRAAQVVRTRSKLSMEALLGGFLEIANERMAGAIRKISVRDGYDPAASVMVAFGGAGGQHACAIAASLGMHTVLCPADAGLLSAEGLRTALVERFAERQILQTLDSIRPSLEALFRNLESDALAYVRNSGFGDEEVTVRRRIVQLRLLGQDSTLDIEFSSPADVEGDFVHRYREVYGYFPAGRTIEVAGLRAVASTKRASLEKESFDSVASPPPNASNMLDSPLHGRIPVYRRNNLRECFFEGPAIVQDHFSTTFVEPDWTATLGSLGTLRLQRLRTSHYDV